MNVVASNASNAQLCKLVRVYYSSIRGYYKTIIHCSHDYAMRALRISEIRYTRASNDMRYATVFGPVSKRGSRRQLKRWSSKEAVRYSAD